MEVWATWVPMARRPGWTGAWDGPERALPLTARPLELMGP